MTPPPQAASFRCTRASEEHGDALAGTASTVRAFLLIEAPGAWGAHAMTAGLLPREVRRHLRNLEREHKVRPLLIRHGGRPHRTHLHVYAAYTAPGHAWLEHAVLDHYEELLDHDLGAIGQGRSPGFERCDGAIYLVCTHGRHDACCAERGRPVWEALRRADPERAWQVSHIGGDRFAANVLVLPDGLYYGRVTPSAASELMQAHSDGNVLLDHLRGRSAWGFAVQAAEIELRRHLGAVGLADVQLVGRTRDGEITTATFRVAGSTYAVRVRTTPGEPRRLTCSGPSSARPLEHELLSID